MVFFTKFFLVNNFNQLQSSKKIVESGIKHHQTNINEKNIGCHG
jgi:hypothetical protein